MATIGKDGPTGTFQEDDGELAGERMITPVTLCCRQWLLALTLSGASRGTLAADWRGESMYVRAVTGGVAPCGRGFRVDALDGGDAVE
jgi:hypothetical protein